MTQPDHPTVDAHVSAPHRSHAILRYTTLRGALFVLALGLLWLVRFRGVLLVAIALILSGLASFVLLARQRGEMSARLHAAQTRRQVRASTRAAREDEP